MNGMMRSCLRAWIGVMAVVATAGWLAASASAGADSPPAQVGRVKVLTDKAPDCSTLKSIVESVTRGCKTNDERAVAIYNFCRLAWYHRAYPGEPGGVAALKMLHAYGWSLCGGQHAVLSALWRAAGWEWRFVGWPGHTTVEVNYDGKWHYFDTFLKFYVWMDAAAAPGGRTIAGQADVHAHNELVTRDLVLDKARKVYYRRDNRFEVINDKANWTAPAFLVCGDGPEGVLHGVARRNRAGSPTGWAGIKFDEDGYTTDVDLVPGESLELLWSALPKAHWWNGRKYVPDHTCGDKDYRNSPEIGPILEPYAKLTPRGARTYASGRLIFAPDFARPGAVSALAGSENVKLDAGKLVPADASKPASITVELHSPYVMSLASGSAEGADSAEVSTDGGKTFKAVELKDFSEAVGGKYACRVKLGFKEALKGLKLEVIVQHNRCVLPYLSPGRNTVTVSTADPKQLGDGRLAVTYAYCLGSRNRSYEQLAEQSAELGRAHAAQWTETPTVVRKVFKASELPATFTIDVPTPKDKYPVYPRMLLLRREVLAAGAEPMPLPEGAVEPKTGPDDELKTLPNPFLMGLAAPPKRVERPTERKEVPLACSHVVKSDGKVFDNNFIKWRPKSDEAWVMLVGGELGKLPAAKDIAGARICFPVTNSCPQATTQVGCTLLAEPFEKMKPYDFKKLGELLATVDVPKQPAPGEAKYYKIDVTRAVKQLAAGEAKFHGFCIRTIPNRAVDEGWTTRIDITKDKPTFLELDVYAAPAK